MDSFLHKLKQFIPDGFVKKQVLSKVARTVDPSLWTDEKIELIFRRFPDEVPIDDLAALLYCPGVAEAMPGSAERWDPIATVERLDPIAKEAATAVLQAGEQDVDMNESAWKELHGDLLEPALRENTDYGDSPVRLIDARFLIELHKRCGKLQRRQDLPNGAFLSLEAVKRMPMTALMGSDTLRIASISHPWQQPDHPDPQSLNLGILAQFLQILLSYVGGTFAIFFDFASLLQKGPNAEERSDKEAALFKQALYNMMDWYSHPNVLTLKLSNLPEGYPEGFEFPVGVTPNTADYYGRGWCFCESSVSNMVKSHSLVFDLGKFSGKRKQFFHVWKECKAGRQPPLAPDDFRVQLAQKSFTSKKADETMVGNLYEDTCRVRIGQAETLAYMDLGWGDVDMAVLGRLLGTVALPLCRELLLHGNKIGDEGMRWLSEPLSNGALPSCQMLSLAQNTIGDEGMRWFSTALGQGALPMCQNLTLHTNHIGDDGLRWLSDALRKGALPVCQTLYLDSNKISTKGRRLFKDALGKAGRSGLKC